MVKPQKEAHGLIFLKTFFGGLICGKVGWVTVIFGGAFTLGKKRMQKDSKLKDFVLFAKYYLKLLCYNSCHKI